MQLSQQFKYWKQCMRCKQCKQCLHVVYKRVLLYLWWSFTLEMAICCPSAPQKLCNYVVTRPCVPKVNSAVPSAVHNMPSCFKWSQVLSTLQFPKKSKWSASCPNLCPSGVQVVSIYVTMWPRDVQGSACNLVAVARMPILLLRTGVIWKKRWVLDQ